MVRMKFADLDIHVGYVAHNIVIIVNDGQRRDAFVIHKYQRFF